MEPHNRLEHNKNEKQSSGLFIAAGPQILLKTLIFGGILDMRKFLESGVLSSPDVSELPIRDEKWYTLYGEVHRLREL